MKFNQDGSVEFGHEEFENLAGSKICKGCGTMLPLWEWAKRDPSVGCKDCKKLPSQEDVDGIRREHTPKDWRQPRQKITNTMRVTEALKVTAYLNLNTLQNNPELGCVIIEDAARLTGLDIKVTYKNGVYTAILECNNCHAKNAVPLQQNGKVAICGKCKEAL